MDSAKAMESVMERARLIAVQQQCDIDPLYLSPRISAFRSRYLASDDLVKSVGKTSIDSLLKCSRDPVVPVTDTAYYAEIARIIAEKSPDDRVVRRENARIVELEVPGGWPIMSITRQHDQFLRRQYSGPPDKYDAYLYALIARYPPMYMGGVPDDVFDFVGVTHECYSCPLSRYTGARQVTFTSAYPDIDRFFGSMGWCNVKNLAAAAVHGANFEMHPPYIEEIVFAALIIAESILTRAPAELPISFFLVLPTWDDVIEMAARSRFFVRKLLIRGDRMRYRISDGFVKGNIETQQFSKTNVVFLQNKSGAQKWPCTDCFVDELVDIWRGYRIQRRK